MWPPWAPGKHSADIHGDKIPIYKKEIFKNWCSWMKHLVILKWKLISIPGQELRTTQPVLRFAFLSVCVCICDIVSTAHVRTLVTSGLLPLTCGFWDLAQQAHVASALVRFTCCAAGQPRLPWNCWEPGETRISSNSSKSLDFFQSPAAQASTSPSAKVIDIHYHTWLQCTIFKSTRNQV